MIHLSSSCILQAFIELQRQEFAQAQEERRQAALERQLEDRKQHDADVMKSMITFQAGLLKKLLEKE